DQGSAQPPGQAFDLWTYSQHLYRLCAGPSPFFHSSLLPSICSELCRRWRGYVVPSATSHGLDLGPAFEHKYQSPITLLPVLDSETEQESAMDFLHDHHDQHDNHAEAERGALGHGSDIPDEAIVGA
ncbi:hypothetical protein BD310DRAFT_998676, partial [Dichomitus squalens]